MDRGAAVLLTAAAGGLFALHAAGGATAATIAGQLTPSAVVDHSGWLGVERQPVGPGRVAGILLLVAGVALVVRD